MFPSELFDLASFQREHTNHLGVKLKDDSILGPETRWALAMASQPLDRQEIVKRALGYYGMTEDPPGSNRGPQIDVMNRRCGVGVGVPWCASFVSWCLSLPGYQEIKCGSVMKLVKTLITITEPLPGDVIYFMKPDGIHGHCGLLLGCSLGEIMTVEGNLNHAVRVVTRDMNSVKYLRSVLPPQIPGIPPKVPKAIGTDR